MTEEQKYLLKNGCDDLVINEESRPENRIYVSDIMQRWKEKQLILSGVSKDVLNWLKSELAQETKNKLTKRINKDKIELLELIIKRLTK
jgi:hypothetical protein